MFSKIVGSINLFLFRPKIRFNKKIANKKCFIKLLWNQLISRNWNSVFMTFFMLGVTLVILTCNLKLNNNTSDGTISYHQQLRNKEFHKIKSCGSGLKKYAWGVYKGKAAVGIWKTMQLQTCYTAHSCHTSWVTRSTHSTSYKYNQ